MFNEYRDVMTVNEVAQALGVCRTSVYRMVKDNVIGHRTVGRKILIPKVCLVDYVNSARFMVSKL